MREFKLNSEATKAWQGLKNHGVEAWVNMPQNQKDSINQAYQQYIFTTTENCPN